jgi:hypothetical protein
MKLKIFLIILAVVYSIFLLTFLQNFGLNFFSKIKNEEIYFLSFNNQNFTIFSNSYQECKINNQSVFLDYGTNNFPSQPYVLVNCSNRTIWFKLNSTIKQNIQLRSYQFEIKDSKLIVELNGNSSLLGLYSIPISINNKRNDILYYFKPGNFSIYKEFQINQNANVSINFFGKQINKTLAQNTNYPIAFLIAFLIILALSVYLFEIDEAFLIVSFFIIIYFQFILPLPQNIQLLFIPLLFLIFAKNKKVNKKMFKIEKTSLLFAGIFVLFIFLIKALIGYSSVWGYYYSRMAEETYLHSSPFFFDKLSYLGREFIYPYGYFDFSAGIAKILNVDYLEIEPLIHAFLLFLFCYSTFLIFKKASKNLLGAFLFLSQTFVFITSIISPLHIFSLLFLNLSILFLLSDKKIFSAISLAISFISHSLSIFFFPFFIIPFFEKKKIKDYISIIAIACILSFPFYLNFLKVKPIEVASFSLGLLQPTQGILSENLFLIPLLFVSASLAFLRNYQRKENLIAILMLLLNIFVYRINIASVFLISYAISKTFTKDKIVYIFPILNLFFASLIYSGTNVPCEWGAATQTCIAPMLYIGKFSYSNVSVPGYFGHLETFFGKQPVLSDYYVEYAKPENFYAQENFCKTGNFSCIQKFKIGIVATSKYYCSEIQNQSKFQKVYTNGYFDVYLQT